MLVGTGAIHAPRSDSDERNSCAYATHWRRISSTIAPTASARPSWSSLSASSFCACTRQSRTTTFTVSIATISGTTTCTPRPDAHSRSCCHGCDRNRGDADRMFVSTTMIVVFTSPIVVASSDDRAACVFSASTSGTPWT